jgi:uroporphyrinogen decarboxylase
MKKDRTVPSKPMLRVLQGLETDHVPAWFMRQAGRYLPEYRAIRKDAGSFLDLCYTPALAAEVSLQPLRRFGMDGVIMFSDILVIPDALGIDVAFKEGEGPLLEPVTNAGDIPRYEPEKALAHLAPVLETLKTLAASDLGSATLIGFAGAPWTVATYVVEGGSSRDFATAKAWAYRDPEGFGKLMAVLVDATADYLVAQVEAGAETVQLFDSWAGVLPEAAFARWCIEPAAEIVRRFKDHHPDVPVIGFPRGAGVLYERYVQETGVDAVSIDTTLPLGWAQEHLQSRVAVQGNLDPIALLAGGDAMRNQAANILRTFKGGPHVFNLGHGILPQTPPEHLAELIAIVRG